jgi:hypothetical protein
MPHAIKRRKANWLGHVLQRNLLLKHTTEEQIEGRMQLMERRGKRHKQLLDDLKETSGCWKLKEEALNHTVENSLWMISWTCLKPD